MKTVGKYLHPSLLSLPTYLGLFAFVLMPPLFAIFVTNQMFTHDRSVTTDAAAPKLDHPAGKIYVSKKSVANTGDTLTLTADAYPQGGKVEYVRYYFLNPVLTAQSDWGPPDWCSCSRLCSATDACMLKTWNLGESGDAQRSYAISWGPDTTSGISTQASRKLNPVNLPPGVYEVFIQVKDTAGNVNEAADSVKIVVSNPTAVSHVLGAQTPEDLTINDCGSDQGNGVYLFTASGGDTSRLPLYQLDQGAWQQMPGPSLWLTIPGGEHFFTVESADPAGNPIAARCTFTAK